MTIGYYLDEKLEKLQLEQDGHDVGQFLVIGLDFGTTYSGAAWATSTDLAKDEINHITQWPDSVFSEGKVPTEIWYGDDDDEPVWGYSVPADVEPLRWFKLLLLRGDDVGPELSQSPYFARAREMLIESGKTAVAVIADYLRLFWAHVLSTIEKERGESVVEALAIHVVITVPAIWKSYARWDMEEAARRAGLLDVRKAGPTKLTFATEPEAAALSTILEYGSVVCPGDVYMVCDAGGATVDLISYRVKSTEPIILQEAVEGTGGLCGGIFVDEAFENVCKGRLGSTWELLSKTSIREMMRTQWEHGIKEIFRPVQRILEYMMRLPAELLNLKAWALTPTSGELKFSCRSIQFEETEIERVFAGTFAEIEKLINRQIKKASIKGLSVTGILLVGGLGSSPYLHEYLKTRLVSSQPLIQILQSSGVRPKTAICRGAVLKGILEQVKNRLNSASPIAAPIMIESTVSRASYGIEFAAEFDSSRHLLEDMDWNPLEGAWFAVRQMAWFLKRGRNVASLKPVRRPYRILYHERMAPFTGTLALVLYECEENVPPTRRTSAVRVVGKISCDLDLKYSDLPNHRCPKSGITAKILRFELELVPSGASIEFVCYVGGVKYQGKSSKICVVD